jgi:adenosine deaminase CECR1
MVKANQILVESCPISNEILRLSSSILAHSLPALLSRGVAVCLNNDDPAVLGHGKNGVSHDYWQAFMAWENLGLEGLATMMENSVKWSAFEDQNQTEWIRDINHGYNGKGVKARVLNQWKVDFEKWCAWVIETHPSEASEVSVGGWV